MTLLAQAWAQLGRICWEWLVRPQYDDIGYVVTQLGQLPHVIITLPPDPQ